MNIIYLSGSPRKKSNTDLLLQRMLAQTGGEFVKVCDLDIGPCRSCWGCLKRGACVFQDDLTDLTPRLLAADALVLGSPVFFNGVTAQLKAFMDRTWSMRKQLRNKVGGAVVVGRRYGAEGALVAINGYFAKHEMIVANRGVSGIAFRSGEIEQDEEALQAADRLAQRLLELGALLGSNSTP